MRGYIKATCCLLALSMLAGCGKNGPDKMNGVTFKLDGFNLDDAKAMAHLQSDGSATKTSIEFEQADALYLVYDDNEILLPETKFSVEVPDDMSNWEKNQLLKDIHITIRDPFIKDCGKYIFVRTALRYYTTFDGFLSASPDDVRAFHLIRKEDGKVFTITDWGNGMQYLLLYHDMVVDSSGNYYLVIAPGSASTSVHRLCETQDGFEVRTATVGWWQIDIYDQIDGMFGIAAVADQCQLTQKGPVVIGKDDKLYTIAYVRKQNETDGGCDGNVVLGIVSPDLTCEKVNIDGMLIGFHKSGSDLMLFVADRSTFKLYDATDGCKLLSSVTKEGYDERFMFEGFQELGYKDGVYSYYGAHLIVRFDVNSGECTVSEVNETICNYLSYCNTYCGGKFYVAYSPDGENYVEVLKVDVMAETVEKLKRLDGPEGCFFSGGITIENESEGKLLIAGTFIRKDEGMGVEEVNQQIIVPEIAQAYAEANAEANAVKDYGIDFGTYKVVNVVPLTDDLDSSEN